MLPVIWLEEAENHLTDILSFLVVRNASAAENLYDEIRWAASQIPLHPFLYRIGKLPNTRELVVTPSYIVVYQLTDKAVEIVAVMHTRQQYP